MFKFETVYVEEESNPDCVYAVDYVKTGDYLYADKTQEILDVEAQFYPQKGLWKKAAVTSTKSTVEHPKLGLFKHINSDCKMVKGQQSITQKLGLFKHLKLGLFKQNSDCSSCLTPK